ncbi:MAG: hypothetical protein K1X67_06710 [Fimbriimonadaceae bacterium]|nr:hypothetical protein [Fimbriimonadaceae bacterium]
MIQRFVDSAWLATPLLAAISFVCARTTMFAAFGLFLLSLLFKVKVRTFLVLMMSFLWLGTLLAPIDITFKNVPGPPRWVPYVIGLPTMETVQEAKRGDACLGGCTIGINDPKWVLVW